MARGFTHESPTNNSVEYYTPPEIFEALGVEFDLDPCSPGKGKSFVPAHTHYTALDDGLQREWMGNVWVNPPYGRHTPAWLKKLVEHGQGMALVFSRTDTRWFQEAAQSADAICFISGRIYFYQGSIHNRSGRPAAGSLILAYGTQNAQSLISSGLGLTLVGANLGASDHINH